MDDMRSFAGSATVCSTISKTRCTAEKKAADAAKPTDADAKPTDADDVTDSDNKEANMLGGKKSAIDHIIINVLFKIFHCNNFLVVQLRIF